MNALHLRADRSSQAYVLIAGCPPAVAEQLSQISVNLGYRAFLWDRPTDVPGQILKDQFQVCVCGSHLSESQIQLLWDTHCAGTQFLWIQDDSSGRTPPFPADVVPGDLPHREWVLILRAAVTRAVLQEQVETLTSQLQQCLFRGLVCESRAMRQLRSDLFQQARRDAPLLLTGEAGSEFSEVSWIVHQAGGRSEAPYLAIDTAALSAEAFEHKLFHPVECSGEPDRPSELERLDGGTLFIHRAESLARNTQKKLIRFLESPAIPRSDSLTLRYINLRLIVGSSADRKCRHQAPLLAYLSERHDAAELRLPPLRERRDDLRMLATNCLAEQAALLGIFPPAIREDGFDAILSYDWPGNEDELKRVLTNLVRNSSHEPVTAEKVQHWIGGASADAGGAPGLSLAEMERQLIEATFARCGGNRERTAQMLGIGLRTLSGKLRQYGYPPRGGPGSNRRRKESAPQPETARKAA